MFARNSFYLYNENHIKFVCVCVCMRWSEKMTTNRTRRKKCIKINNRIEPVRPALALFGITASLLSSKKKKIRTFRIRFSQQNILIALYAFASPRSANGDALLTSLCCIRILLSLIFDFAIGANNIIFIINY